MFGGQGNDDTKEEPMESCYLQDSEEKEKDEDGDGDETEVTSRADESYNLADNYLYDKWLQEQDPVLIDVNIRKLKEKFPEFQEKMIKNVLLRDDVKGDVEKADNIIEEFRVMRQRDSRHPQQNRESNRNQQGRQNKGGRMDGNRRRRGRGRGRGRGRQDNEEQYCQNQRGPQSQTQNWPHPDQGQQGTYPPQQGTPFYPQHVAHMLFEREQRSRRVGAPGPPPCGPYRHHQPDHFQHQPQMQNQPSFHQNYRQDPRFYDPAQAPPPQNQRGPSYQGDRNSFQEWQELGAYGPQAPLQQSQRGGPSRWAQGPSGPRQKTSGNSERRRRENWGNGLRSEDRTGEQRSSNESLQSNASDASGCSERKGGGTKRGRRRNRGGKGRGWSDRQQSQEAPGALQTQRHEGGLPCGRPRGRGGMVRAQSFAAFEQSVKEDEHQSSTTELEPNMLCVRGLSSRTTEENLTNFIEAKSGDEVLQINMFGNGKALVVLDNLTDFNKTKQKAEQRGLDDAQLEIERVEVCQTIHVSGLSSSTTHDALELYFENTKRSGGDTVDEVKYNTGDDEAVVHFTQTEVVDRVLAKEHVLNGAKLVVRKYYPCLEDEEEDEDNDGEDSKSKTVRTAESSQKACSVKDVTCKESKKTREGPADQQLSIAVDAEKMECIMGSEEKEKLVTTLEQHNCKLQWRLGQAFALVNYSGKATEWQDKCIEIMNNFLKRFVSRKIPLEVDCSEGIIARLAEIRDSMKHRVVRITAGSSAENCLRMVCDAVNVEKCEEEINEIVKTITKEEVKKTYKSTTIPILEEHIALLKKLQIFEKLEEKHRDLEVDIDSESGEIYLEGPPDQFKDANLALRRQMIQIASRNIATTSHTLEVLSSDQGLSSIKDELQRRGVDAVFVFDPERSEKEGRTFVVGKDSAEAEKAADMIKNMTLEQKIEVEKESNAVLASSGWKILKEKIPTEFGVRIHSNAFGDTWVTGFRHDVNKAVAKFSAFLDEHTVRRDIFTSDKLVLRYLLQHRRDELDALETSLLKFKVKINRGNDEGNLVIHGTKEGLRQLRVHLHNLSTSVEGLVHDVKQPGVKRLFTSGGGDRLVRSVERDHSCVIEVERKFDTSPHGGSSTPASSSLTPGDSDDSSSDDGDVYPGRASHGGLTNTSVQAGANNLIITTPEGKTITWKVGDITRERADVLVASVASSLDLTAGPFAKAFSDAAGPALQQACSAYGKLRTGETLVTVPGNLACRHVILTVCCNWDSGNGSAQSVLRDVVKKSLEEAHRLGVGSIAFPTLGTGNLHFPWSVAADVLTEQALAFSKRNPSTPLHDIRVIVFEKDPKSIQAFHSDIARVQSQYGNVGAAGPSVTPVIYGGRQGAVSVEVVQGDITKESTDVIVNVNGTDMVMNNAGAVSKAIARAGGDDVQRECSQKGQQPPGSVVMTTAGNLLAKCIIHVIPARGGFSVANMLSGAMGYVVPNQSGRDDIETSVEKCLNLADTSGYQSISLPAVGTGSAGGDPQNSAQSMLRAVHNFSQSSPQNLRQVRIVIFQGHMVSIFQQEQQRLGLGTSVTPVSVPGPQTMSQSQTKKRRAPSVSVRHSACVRLHIYGKDKLSVEDIVAVLQKSISDACTKQKVENEAVSSLSDRQVTHLQSKATKLDVDIAIEPRINRIVVSGNPKDVTDMMGVVWEAINESKEKKRKQERVKLVAKNVQWYYSLNSSGHKVPFDKNSNAELEVAQTEHKKTVRVPVGGETFVIDIPSKRGNCIGSGQLMEITREVKGTGGDGISLPQNWDPMPNEGVHLVTLSPGCTEFQSVAAKFRNSGGPANVVQVERIQNPLLYKSYMVRKQKMDKENGGHNNERELWHGTASKNIRNINTQGFNRSFCGAHGTAYGNGVYFAKNASYSMGYAPNGQMYLARVLVGMYTKGRSGMIVPPAKDPGAPEILYDSVVDNTANPSIYVVFFDSLCYPEYLVTFR